MNDAFHTLQQFDLGSGKQGSLYSLPALEKAGVGPISRLPVSIRIVLESVLRNCDGKKVTRAGREDARQLERQGARAGGDPLRRRAHRPAGFHRRAAAGRSRRHALAPSRGSGSDPKMIEPLVPVDLVVDHSVQVDFFGSRRCAAAATSSSNSSATASATSSSSGASRRSRPSASCRPASASCTR